METLKTILYYTGNRKHSSFESKVRETLLRNCQGLPIVSVSQKPIDLGRNICVGEVGHSYLNVYRQIQVGAKEIESEYIVFAEDDFLYPPEYFDFMPFRNDFYRYSNVWMIIRRRDRYYKTPPIGGAQILRRDFVISALEEYLDGCPEWVDGDYKVDKPDWNDAPFILFSGPPIIAFKPTNNLSRSGSYYPGMEKTELPVWGKVDQLREQYDFG